ncbi:MAG: DUF483 domain-containing protein [Candidatus Woesearchaeota archaeon]
MIEKLKQIFGSYSKAEEILYLLEDAKEVVRQGFYEKELCEVERFCQENKLFIVKSKFKVQLENKDYTNKGKRVEETEPGMYFVYISKDEQKAYLASYYELTEDHKNLGLILGYPECCVEFFCNNFNENKTDLQLKPTNVWTNLSKREEDCVLLSHFPCSCECNESITIARKNLESIKKNNPDRAEEIRLNLSP